MSRMLKAIIFDCFGVLTNDAWKDLQREYCRTEEQRKHAQELDQVANRGGISHMEFIEKVGLLTGLSQDEVRQKLDVRKNNDKLFSYIQQSLKANYKIGLLSNAADDWINEMFTAEQRSLFDSVLLSYKIGITKPNPKIYLEMTRYLGVSPEECVFIDDVERYCEGAREVGMQAILYKSFDEFKRELEVIL